MHINTVLKAGCFVLLASWGAACLAATSVLDVGLVGDGQAGDTAALQRALNAGQTELYFPAGEYKLGTVELPDNTTLRFEANATVSLDPEAVIAVNENVRPFLWVTGDRVVVDGLDGGEVLSILARDERRRTIPAVTDLIYGEDASDLLFIRLRAELPEARGRRQTPCMIRLVGCRDIELADSQIRYVEHGIITDRCKNLQVHGNRALDSSTLTTFGPGSQGLRHYDNWSRTTVYQCVFRGGAPDPSRKAPSVPLGSSTAVIRDLDVTRREDRGYYFQELKKLGLDHIELDPERPTGYYTHLSGGYDIQVTHNYAEYGRSLAWGNKGRQVVIEGNIARFMNDYCFGVEGGENVVIANNIAINGRSVGIMSMYWGNKLLVTGNLVMVRDEPYIQEYSAFDEQSAYWGGLMRFHQGPRNASDQDAGSIYGARQATITGNLLVNELHDQMRSIRLEGGGDVFISENKLLNGEVFKSSAGSVTILNNEFITDMPQQPRMAKFKAGTQRVVMKNNVMRYEPSIARNSTGRKVVESTRDEALPADEDEKVGEPRYAVQVDCGRGSLDLFLAQGNIVTGWDGVLDVNGLDRRIANGPFQLVVRDNTVSGHMRVAAIEGKYLATFENNLNLNTLEPVKPEIVESLPTE